MRKAAILHKQSRYTHGAIRCPQGLFYCRHNHTSRYKSVPATWCTFRQVDRNSAFMRLHEYISRTHDPSEQVQ